MCQLLCKNHAAIKVCALHLALKILYYFLLNSCAGYLSKICAWIMKNRVSYCLSIVQYCWKDVPVTGEKLCQPRLKCGTRHYWRIAAVGILWKQKKSAKNDDFFTSAEFFCRLFFLPTINFYRRIFLPTFFSQTWTFSIF